MNNVNSVNQMTTNILDAIESKAKQYPNKIILSHKHKDHWEKWTYQEIIKKYKEIASELEQTGLKIGDRIIILTENHPVVAMTYMAALSLKATTVLIDPHLPVEQLKKLILYTDARLLLTSQKFASIVEQFNDIKYPVLTLEYTLLNSKKYLNPLADFPTQTSLETQDTPDPMPHIANIFFTSGTEGDPKGVMLSHEALIKSVKPIEQICSISSEDNILAVLPFFHIAAFLANLLLPLIYGIESSSIYSIDKETIFTSLKEKQPTVLLFVPRILEQIEDVFTHKFNSLPNLIKLIFNKFKLEKTILQNKFGGKLRFILEGGSSLSEKTALFYKRMGIKVLKVYGASETIGPVVTDRFEALKTYGVGIPLPGYDVKILDQDENSEGQICLRTTSIMEGYFRNKELTEQVIKEGWFYTDDIGKIDKNGTLIITGRKSELIVLSNGKKVSPLEIESLYKNINYVTDYAITSFYSQKQMRVEIVGAFVLATNNEKENEVIQECVQNTINKINADLPSYMQITKVVYLDEIPKTAILKVKYKELKKRIQNFIDHEKNKPRQVYVTINYFSDSEKIKVANLLRMKVSQLTKFPEENISFTDPLPNYGMDSLNLIDFHSWLKDQFKLKIELSELLTLYTLESYVDFVCNENRNERPINSNTTNKDIFSQNSFLQKSKFSQIILSFLFYLTEKFSRFIWKLEITGQENIPKNGAFILCPNHASALDPLWLFSGLSNKEREKIASIGKAELWKNPLTKKLVSVINAIPVDRFNDVSSALEKARLLLEKGTPLLVFPEGTRTRDGRLHQFKNGVARLAQECSVPLIPIAIQGAYRVLPPNKMIPRFFNFRELSRYKITIKIGQPISADDISPNEINNLTDRLRNIIIEMLYQKAPENCN